MTLNFKLLITNCLLSVSTIVTLIGLSFLSVWSSSFFLAPSLTTFLAFSFVGTSCFGEGTGAWGMDFVSSSPLFSTTLPFFQNFHINHSFFKIFIIIRFTSFDNISRRHTSWIIRVFCVHSFSTDLYGISRKTVDTEYTSYSWCMTSTDIVKWRKTND